MKKLLPILLALFISVDAYAWWDPGHLVTAMVAYLNLDPAVKKKVDALTKTLQRDYPYTNHFITTGPWPDDLKAEGVHSFDTWHYTNMYYNPSGLALPPKPKIDAIWAINQMNKVLSSPKPRAIDQARHLAFLVHIVGDLHQPLHSTSMFNNDQPGGNIGGNAFPLEGEWRNLHQLWDDGCGFLSSYNDINPYGKPKKALTKEDIKRIKKLAKSLIKEFPKKKISGVDNLDPDFWALESHKLAIQFGYKGVVGKNDRGRNIFIQQKTKPSELYIANGQDIVKKRLVMGGYRLAEMLNKAFAE